MQNYDPFSIVQDSQNRYAKVAKGVEQDSALDNILAQAMQSNSPDVLQNTLGQILSKVAPEKQQAALGIVQSKINTIKQKEMLNKQKEAYRSRGLGEGAEYLPDSVVVEELKNKAKDSRLGQYGLGGVNNGNQNGQAPLAINPNPQGQQINPQMQQGNQPPPTPESQNPFKNLTKEQLIIATGAPDREISEPAKAELRQREQNEKINEKNKKLDREEVVQFHKESGNYDEELFKQTKIAKNQIDTIKSIDNAIKSGNVKPSSFANVFKGMGKFGDKISEALLNKDEATLQASIPQLLEGWKEVFGVRLTDADLRLLQDKLPSIGKSPEANNAIVKILKKYADMTLLRSQIAKDIKEQNNGLRPLGYADKIETRFDEMVMPVKVINPSNGKVIEIPAYKLSDAIKAGGKLAPQEGSINE